MKTYQVKVNNREIAVSEMRVSAFPLNKVFDGTQRPLAQTEEACYVTLDITGETELEISVEEDFSSYEIRPLRYQLADVRRGNTVKLTVKGPMQFTFEPDGYHNALHVFVNTKSAGPEEHCIYYGKGEHDAGLIWLESGQTLYLEEGAVVYGVVYAKDAQNIRILGRGVLDASRYRRNDDTDSAGGEILDALSEKGFCEADRRYAGNLVLNHCKDVLVEGVILKDAPLWSLIVRDNCQNITIDNVKVIGQWRYNSDGIDICTSQNVVVKNCFVRSFDDCFVARGAYLNGEEGNVENVLVENCVFWCDWGKSLEIWCGQKPTAIRNIVFSNIDLIRLSCAAMNITTWYGSESSVVENVSYRNIHIDKDEFYRNPQVESGGNPEYLYQPGYRPTIVQIYAQKLGRMVGLGTQIHEEGDLSQYHLRYSNITFENIDCDDPSLRVRVQEMENVLAIENITVRNAPFVIGEEQERQDEQEKNKGGCL